MNLTPVVIVEPVLIVVKLLISDFVVNLGVCVNWIAVPIYEQWQRKKKCKNYKIINACRNVLLVNDGKSCVELGSPVQLSLYCLMFGTSGLILIAGLLVLRTWNLCMFFYCIRQNIIIWLKITFCDLVNTLFRPALLIIFN